MSNFFIRYSSAVKLRKKDEKAQLVKIIHRKKHSQKSAFWKRGTAVLTSCLSGCFVIGIKSKWVYSHIKLSFSISYMMIKVRTQFDMAANPP